MQVSGYRSGQSGADPTAKSIVVIVYIITIYIDPAVGKNNSRIIITIITRGAQPPPRTAKALMP